MKGFRTFLLRGNVIDLAVAVVMGVAFNNIVQAMVKDVITPLIAAAGGTPHFGGLKLTVSGTTISYGVFLNAVVAFGIIAAVVYFLLVAPMHKMLAYAQRNKDAAERQCPECLSMIPYGASRCMYCTAVVPPADQPAPAATTRATVAAAATPAVRTGTARHRAGSAPVAAPATVRQVTRYTGS